MKKRFAIFFILIAFGIRFVPLKLPNVEFVSSAIAFLVLSFGLKTALPLMLGLVLLSDIALSGVPQSWELIVILGWASVIFTQWFIKGKKFYRVLLMEVMGTFSFFFVTNSLVFFMYNYYPKTPTGYIACLVAGIPFMRNQLIGNTLLSYIVYLTFHLAESREIEGAKNTISG